MHLYSFDLQQNQHLTTEAFIGYLCRIFAGRGRLLHIYTDNGTNLVGAVNSLEF